MVYRIDAFSIDDTCDFYDFTNVEFLYRVIKSSE